MATLEIDINCLCLFVRDEASGTVHALMPATHDLEHPHGGGSGDKRRHTRHVVRLLHECFQEGAGRPMEGLALVVGSEGQTVTNMNGLIGAPEDQGTATGCAAPAPVLPDLTELTGARVRRELVADQPNPEVAARLTFRTGRVTRLKADAFWKLGEQTFFVAHRVVWRAEDVSDELTWVSLDGAAQRPLASLREIAPEVDGTYRLSVYHVLEEDLPPTGLPTLDPAEAIHHFLAYARLLDIDFSAKGAAPRRSLFSGGKVHCGGAVAALEARTQE